MKNLAVLDTNVLVSALLKPGSLPATVTQAIRDRRLMPVVCDAIVDEYRNVLARPRLALPPRDVADILSLIEPLANWVRITPYLSALKLSDPADWPFIVCALAADCPVITGNKRHFPPRVGVSALSVKEWLEDRDKIG